MVTIILDAIVLVQIFMSLAPSYIFRLLSVANPGEGPGPSPLVLGGPKGSESGTAVSRARVYKTGICKSFESIPANQGF